MEGFRPAKDTVQVPSTKLDTYCARRGVLPSVIKIDVECYESHVVNGALQVLEQARPSVVCEILPDSDPALIGQTVGPFADLGYHMYRWTRADAWTECSPKDIVEQVVHDGNDWLFKPEAVTDRFREALDIWRHAVSECTPDHTKNLARNANPRPVHYSVPSIPLRSRTGA